MQTEVLTPARAPSSRVRRADLLAALGLVLLAVGTFLPWLRSGTVDRNSYATGGALRRLVTPDGLVSGALTVWPFLSLACAAALALLLLGRSGYGLLLGGLAAAAAGTVAAVTLTVGGAGVVHPAALGPAVTALGSVLVLLIALAHAIRFALHPGRTR